LSTASRCGGPCTEEIWTCWRACPEEGHKSNPKDGTLLLQGQAERAGAVQPGEVKNAGRPESGLSISERSYNKKVVTG